MPSVCEALSAIEVMQAAAAARAEEAEKRKRRSKDFYASQPWRRLRYAALRANREKHGCITCEVCGSTEGPFDCDHITPLSKDWSKRLDPANVQIACRACNFGKGNRDSIDWREPAP